MSKETKWQLAEDRIVPLCPSTLVPGHNGTYPFRDVPECPACPVNHLLAVEGLISNADALARHRGPARCLRGYSPSIKSTSAHMT